MENDEKFFELVSFIKASKYRQDILKYLYYDIKTPLELGQDLGIRTNHISNLLADLRHKDLVICITPNVKKGRLYKLTEKGRRVSKFLNIESD